MTELPLSNPFAVVDEAVISIHQYFNKRITQEVGTYMDFQSSYQPDHASASKS